MSEPNSSYPLGYSEDEARRLAAQGAFFEDLTGDVLRRAGIGPGGRVRARQFAFAIGVSSSSLSRSERLWHQRVAPNPVHPSVYDEAKIDISS